MRPIYNQVLQIVLALGDDVTLQPRKSYVAFARQKQFALVKASAITRVDLGLKLKEPPNSSRLQGASGFGSGSITHKLALTSPEEVDDEIAGWPKAASTGI